MPGRCPHCGTRIDGLEAAGPGLHTVGPCGHFVDQTALRELLYASPPLATGRERSATIRERDGNPYIADGGLAGQADTVDVYVTPYNEHYHADRACATHPGPADPTGLDRRMAASVGFQPCPDCCNGKERDRV